MDNGQRISVVEKVGYGLGDTATNLVWRTLMVFLPIFYTDVFGITAASVGMRSEEHTSELQSHSFISYAVFCLKKKKNTEAI